MQENAIRENTIQENEMKENEMKENEMKENKMRKTDEAGKAAKAMKHRRPMQACHVRLSQTMAAQIFHTPHAKHGTKAHMPQRILSCPAHDGRP